MLKDGLKARERKREWEQLVAEEAQRTREAELSAAEPGFEPKKPCPGCPKPKRPRKKRTVKK